MTPADKHGNLRYYSKYLKRETHKIHCPKCKKSILPKEFETHCLKIHQFNGKYGCVWCWGSTSWRPGQKTQNAIHLLDCFKKFIRPQHQTTRPINIPLVELDLNVPLCAGESFFDRDGHSLRNVLPPEGFGFFSILKVDLLPLEHGHANLDLAAAYVQKYLDTRDTHDWLHVMVKAISFEKFVRAMTEEEGMGTISGLLPFSCWCDGGPYKRFAHRQHRHFIAAVTPKGHFTNKIWPKVVPNSEKPCRYFRGKKSLEIQSPLHLVNTLGYLSGRKSRCRRSQNYLSTENHFYIFKTLPAHYKLALVWLWDTGVLELLQQEKFQNVSVSRVADTPLIRQEGWKQKIEDFYKLERGIVITVAKRFAPTEHVTPYFRYLARDRKIYFQPSAENERLDRDAWLRKQAEGGNCFYDAVGEETWTPRPRDQGQLNDLMPRVYRIHELEADNATLKSDNERLREEMNRLRRKMTNDEHKRLKEKIKELQDEVLFLRSIVINGNKM